jgi:hypothetical protein
MSARKRMAPRSGAGRGGGRVATRWIGDAFVLDGDLQRGAPAVWHGPDAHGKRAARCARARIVEVARDFEFGVDELLRFFAAGTVRGDAIVPRLATYRDDDVLALIDEDVADVTLAHLLARLEEAPSRVGLALYVGRACTRAWQTASMHERVIMEMSPTRIALSWDGAVSLFASPAPSEDAWEWATDPIDAASYDVSFGHEERTLGALLYAIIAGAHPYAAPAPPSDEDDEDDEQDQDDEFESARALLDRRDHNDHVVLDDAADVTRSVRDTVERMLAAERRRSWELITAELDAELDKEGFDARALAGMLDATFSDEKRAALLEREDRLGVFPGAKVAQEEWSLLDDDAELEGEDGGNLSGLWHAPEREPHVEPIEPIDPFDDER